MIKSNLKIKKKKYNKIIFYTILVSLVYIFIAGRDGFLRIGSFYHKIHSLKSHINELKAENSELDTEIKKLTYDDRYIEKIAREELGLIKDGEIVYKFIDDKK